MTAHYYLASTHFYQCSNFNIDLGIDEKKKKLKNMRIFLGNQIAESSSLSSEAGASVKGFICLKY